MKVVRVELGASSYDIDIGGGLIEEVGTLMGQICRHGQAVIITNPVVRRHYGAKLEAGFAKAGFTVNVLEVTDGEAQKTLAQAGDLYLEMAQARAERQTPVVAVGGGVIGDLAGFVAATYKRSVPLVHVPTTLLAQVDSSIGGKVAVNHNQLKNEIGAFYQPKLVITDPETLRTLPPEILSDGLAEVIKYGIIWDAEFFDYLEANMAKIRALDATCLEHIVGRSAEIKAKVVSEDEKESGLRAILNYGHTIAHAVESLSDFDVSHGSAVAIGMVAAARIAVDMKTFEFDAVDRLIKLLERAGLPTRVPDYGAERMIEVMQHDKKVRDGKMRFVLPQAIGEVFVTDQVTPELLRKVLA